MTTLRPNSAVGVSSLGSCMKSHRIRALAICVFLKNQRILVNEAHDPKTQGSFCRPLGGGIEFGETSIQAVAREIHEEIGAEVKNLRLLGTLENIFTYAGTLGHEIVQIYDGELADASLYDQEFIAGVESDGSSFTARWRRLSEFSSKLPLYPSGLLELVSAKARSPSA